MIFPQKITQKFLLITMGGLAVKATTYNRAKKQYEAITNIEVRTRQDHGMPTGVINKGDVFSMKRIKGVDCELADPLKGWISLCVGGKPTFKTYVAELIKLPKTERKMKNMNKLDELKIYEDSTDECHTIKGDDFLKFIPATIKQIDIDHTEDENIPLSLLCGGTWKYYYVKRISEDNGDLLMEYLKKYNEFVRVYKNSEDIRANKFQPIDYEELVQKNEVSISKQGNEDGFWTITYGERTGLITRANKDRLSYHISRKQRQQKRLLKQRLANATAATTASERD